LVSLDFEAAKEKIMLDREKIMQENFDPAMIRKIWKKGNVISDINPDIIRRDRFGDWIKRDDYGNPHSIYGWIIEDIVPISKGGNNEIENLQPLHWKNRRKFL